MIILYDKRLSLSSLAALRTRIKMIFLLIPLSFVLIKENIIPKSSKGYVTGTVFKPIIPASVMPALPGPLPDA